MMRRRLNLRRNMYTSHHFSATAPQKRITTNGVTLFNQTLCLKRFNLLSYIRTCRFTRRLFGVVSTVSSTTAAMVGFMFLLSSGFGSLFYLVEGFQSRQPAPSQQHYAFVTNAASPITSNTALTYLPLRTTRRRHKGIVMGKTRTMTKPNQYTNENGGHRVTPHFMADVTVASSADGESKKGLWQKVR
jgi:hypothetical protein